ncbi:hypothetical protein RRF57_005523 [Xylaria bambusicola]|uniref:Uncharacterized protein n=1 Tax=Xylaria bambusicola TaxID=326684 RepID=A0AAN7UNH0_9PEZI
MAISGLTLEYNRFTFQDLLDKHGMRVPRGASGTNHASNGLFVGYTRTCSPATSHLDWAVDEFAHAYTNFKPVEVSTRLENSLIRP